MASASAPLVAVTGAEGFIGSHLTEALVASGHRVRAMAQYNSFSSYGWLETLAPDVLAEVEIVLGDVRDPGSVRGLITDAEAVYPWPPSSRSRTPTRPRTAMWTPM
ncbi:hypothetical protein SALBM135S_08745 [Streptomyces alboniger]